MLHVFGNAALAGALGVNLIDGFDPTATSVFDIPITGLLDPGSVTGIFDMLDLPTSSDGTWDVEYLSDRVRLEFTTSTEVPEPPGIFLVSAGLGALWFMRQRSSRRRRRLSLR